MDVELGHKESWESWVLKNWCFWTVVLEALESPLDCKEIKPVKPKGNQSWIFIGRTDAGTEVPILWPPDGKNWLIGKDSDAGKDWRQEEKGMTEDKLVGWHHWLNGHEFEQAPGVGDGQGSLVCCSPWGHRVRHAWVTELNLVVQHSVQLFSTPWTVVCQAPLSMGCSGQEYRSGLPFPSPRIHVLYEKKIPPGFRA